MRVTSQFCHLTSYWGVFGVNWKSDLGDSIGVIQTHGLEERGSLRFGGVGTHVKSAQYSERAARLAVRGEDHLCVIIRVLTWWWKCEIQVKPITCIHCKTRLTWNSLLLKETEVQQSAYCVRCSGRQEEFDYLRAIFGDKIVTLLLVALWHKITDLIHELHQSILQGKKGKMATFTWCDVWRGIRAWSNTKWSRKSHLSHIGGQQGLQFLDDKQTQGADRVKQLLQRGSADYHL